MCAALASLELAFPVASYVDPASVALFTTDAGLPFSAAQLDRLLSLLLRRFLPSASAVLYSWYSAHFFLATALLETGYFLVTVLLESGASHAQVQALCRWQTTDSIRIYARLNSSSCARLLHGAMAARISTARAQNLALAIPIIDLFDVWRALWETLALLRRLMLSSTKTWRPTMTPTRTHPLPAFSLPHPLQSPPHCLPHVAFIPHPVLPPLFPGPPAAPPSATSLSPFRIRLLSIKPISSVLRSAARRAAAHLRATPRALSCTSPLLRLIAESLWGVEQSSTQPLWEVELAPPQSL